MSPCDPHEPFAPELLAPPSPSEFLDRYVSRRQPVVLRSLVREDDVARSLTPRRLEVEHGMARVRIARIDDEGRLACDEGRGKGLIYDTRELGLFLRGCANDRPGYVMTPVEELPESLRARLAAPELVPGSRWRRSKLWISFAPSVSPLHRDAAENLHVQLFGKKRFLLSWPRDTSNLYPHSFFSSTPNFSQVDPERPDLARFPRFARARLLGVELEPGDAVYIPSGFWHHVRTIEPAVSVNYWFARGSRLALAVAADVYKRLRGLNR